MSLTANADRASGLDAEWFRRRPDRAHRLRKALPGESPLPGSNFTLAKQVRPGIRLRIPMEVPPQCQCERCLALAWEIHARDRIGDLAVELAAASMKAGR